MKIKKIEIFKIIKNLIYKINLEKIVIEYGCI